MTATDVLIQSLVQSLPGDVTGMQNALRVLSLDASPKLATMSAAAQLATNDLALLTNFAGPWEANIMAISFTKDDGTGKQIPNTDPKDVGIYLILGGLPYGLVEFQSWAGTSIALTDHIKMGEFDQIEIKAHGMSGTATAEVRGELR